VSTSVCIVGVGPNFLTIGRRAAVTSISAAIPPRDCRATQRAVARRSAFLGGAERREPAV
jgi:hypothetical protein